LAAPKRKWQKVIGLGPKGAVDWLLDFSNASADEQNSADVPDLSPIKGPAGNFRELRKQLQTQTPEQREQLMKQFQMANREAFMATFAWWMKRMAGGSHPLQEKLTLFWPRPLHHQLSRGAGGAVDLGAE